MTASLAQQLTALGLHAVASELDDFVARATQKRWGPVEVITHVAELEIAERARRSVERRMKRSRLGRCWRSLRSAEIWSGGQVPATLCSDAPPAIAG